MSKTPKENKIKTIQTSEQASKKKKIIWGTTWGLLLAGGISAGFSIPLIKACQSLPKPAPTLKDDDIISHITSEHTDSKITYGDLNERYVTNNEKAHLSSEMKSQLYRYLYQKEYEGSLWYNAVYHANKINKSKKDFRLKSISKITEEVTKDINELKEKIKKQFGYEKNWEDEFKKELASSQYGNAKNEQEAIDYRVTAKLKNEAFRRYQFEINQDFTYSELKAGHIVANADTFYTLDDGKKVEIAKKGEIIPLDFAKENENFVLPELDSKELKINTEDEYKVPLFVTKSFVKELKNQMRFIPDWIEQKQLITSELSLSAAPVKDKSEKPWTVKQDEIIKLFKYTLYSDVDNLETKYKVTLGIDRIGQFKGIKTIISDTELTDKLIQTALNDKKLIEYVSSNTGNAKKIGSDGFKNISSYISGDATSYLPFLSTIIGDATVNKSIFKINEKNNLFSELKTELLDIFSSEPTLKAQLTNGEFTLDKNDPTFNEKIAEYAKYNEQVDKFIKDMKKEEFDEKVGNIFKKVFGDNADKNKISTIYKVNDNFVFVSSSGIKIQNIFELKTEEIVKKLILKGLKIKSKAAEHSELKEPILNLETMFNSIINEDYEINDLLHIQDFKEFIKGKKFKDLNSKESTFSDADIQNVLEYQAMLKKISKSSIISDKAKQIETYITEQINNQLYGDFKYDAAKKDYYLDPHTDEIGEEAILKYIFKQIQDFLIN